MPLEINSMKMALGKFSEAETFDDQVEKDASDVVFTNEFQLEMLVSILRGKIKRVGDVIISIRDTLLRDVVLLRQKLHEASGRDGDVYQVDFTTFFDLARVMNEFLEDLHSEHTTASDAIDGKIITEAEEERKELLNRHNDSKKLNKAFGAEINRLRRKFQREINEVTSHKDMEIRERDHELHRLREELFRIRSFSMKERCVEMKEQLEGLRHALFDFKKQLLTERENPDSALSNRKILDFAKSISADLEFERDSRRMISHVINVFHMAMENVNTETLKAYQSKYEGLETANTNPSLTRVNAVHSDTRLDLTSFPQFSGTVSTSWKKEVSALGKHFRNILSHINKQFVAMAIQSDMLEKIKKKLSLVEAANAKNMDENTKLLKEIKDKEKKRSDSMIMLEELTKKVAAKKGRGIRDPSVTVKDDKESLAFRSTEVQVQAAMSDRHTQTQRGFVKNYFKKVDDLSPDEREEDAEDIKDDDETKQLIKKLKEYRQEKSSRKEAKETLSKRAPLSDRQRSEESPSRKADEPPSLLFSNLGRVPCMRCGTETATVICTSCNSLHCEPCAAAVHDASMYRTHGLIVKRDSHSLPTPVSAGDLRARPQSVLDWGYGGAASAQGNSVSQSPLYPYADSFEEEERKQKDRDPNLKKGSFKRGVAASPRTPLRSSSPRVPLRVSLPPRPGPGNVPPLAPSLQTPTLSPSDLRTDSSPRHVAGSPRTTSPLRTRSVKCGPELRITDTAVWTDSIDCKGEEAQTDWDMRLMVKWLATMESGLTGTSASAMLARLRGESLSPDTVNVSLNSFDGGASSDSEALRNLFKSKAMVVMRHISTADGTAVGIDPRRFDGDTLPERYRVHRNPLLDSQQRKESESQEIISRNEVRPHSVRHSLTSEITARYWREMAQPSNIGDNITPALASTVPSAQAPAAPSSLIPQHPLDQRQRRTTFADPSNPIKPATKEPASLSMEYAAAALALDLLNSEVEIVEYPRTKLGRNRQRSRTTADSIARTTAHSMRPSSAKRLESSPDQDIPAVAAAHERSATYSTGSSGSSRGTGSLSSAPSPEPKSPPTDSARLAGDLSRIPKVAHGSVGRLWITPAMTVCPVPAN